MELALIVLKALMKMVLLLLIGFIATKAGVLNEERCRMVTDIVLKILMPCLVISGFLGGYDEARLRNLLTALALAVISQLANIVICRVLLHRSDRYPHWRIDRGIATFSNIGFIGVPLITSLYGEEGLLYVTMLVGVSNIAQWAYGEPDISGDFSIKAVLHTFKQPVMIASFAGLAVFFLRLPLPEFVSGTITNIGNCCTTIPMMLVGSSLARCDIGKVAGKLRTYFVMAVKLIIVPLAVILIMKLADAPEIVKISLLIPMACPPATATTMLSIRYGLDDSYAAALTGFGTLLSVATIPLIVLIYSLI